MFILKLIKYKGNGVTIPGRIWAIRILRRWAIALTSSRGKLWEGVAWSAKCTITIHTARCTATHYCQGILYLLLWSICKSLSRCIIKLICCSCCYKFFFLRWSNFQCVKKSYQVSLIANNVGYFVEWSSFIQHCNKELKMCNG